MRHANGGMPDRVFSGMIWTAWGKISRTILQFIVLVLLARLMSPLEFGVIGAAMVVVGFSEILTRVGLGPALVQRPELESRHIGTAFVTSLVLSIIVGGTVLLTAPLLAEFFNFGGLAQVLGVLAMIFPIRGFGLVAESLAQRELDFKTLANSETVSFFVGYFLVGMPMALFGFGVWSIVGANISGSIVKTAIMFRYYPAIGSVPDWKAFRELAYFGGGYTIARIANYIALQGDNMVVGRAMGMTALGIYGRAYQLMSVPATTLGQVLDEVLFPSMARIQNEPDRLAAIYLRGVSLVALVMLPVSVVGMILAPEIVRATLGWKWDEVILPFQILLAGLVMRTSYKLSDSLTRASGAVYQRAWRQVIYGGLVVSGAYLGRYWGVEGSATGVLIAVTINFLLMAQMGLKIVGASWWSFGKVHVNAVLLAVCAGLTTYFAATLFRRFGMSSYLFLAAVGMAIAPMLLLLIRIFPDLLLGSHGRWMIEFSRTYAADRFATRNAV